MIARGTIGRRSTLLRPTNFPVNQALGFEVTEDMKLKFKDGKSMEQVADEILRSHLIRCY